MVIAFAFADCVDVDGHMKSSVHSSNQGNMNKTQTQAIERIRNIPAVTQR